MVEGAKGEIIRVAIGPVGAGGEPRNVKPERAACVQYT